MNVDSPGNGQLGLGMMQWSYGYPNSPELSRLPLPAREHRPLRVALLSLQPELSRRPRDGARAGRGSLARDHSSLVFDLRSMGTWMHVPLLFGLGRSAIRPPIPRRFRRLCTHSFRSIDVVFSTNHKVLTEPPSAIPIESQRTTALLPSLTQLASISEPRIASDQTRGVCLLCAIVLHPFDLVFGLDLGLGNGAVLTRGSNRTQDISGLEHRFAQAPIGRRNGCLVCHFHAFQEQSSLDQKTGVISVRNAFDARTARDLVREFVWQAKGLVSHSSRSIVLSHVFAELDVKHLTRKHFVPRGVFS